MPFYDRGCQACTWTKDDSFEPVAHALTCPACGAQTERIWKQRPSSVISDEWAGGKTFENGFATPQTFYSPSEYRKALAERGLRVRGDGEEHFTPISKEALKKAEELMERMYPCR